MSSGFVVTAYLYLMSEKDQLWLIRKKGRLASLWPTFLGLYVFWLVAIKVTKTASNKNSGDFPTWEGNWQENCHIRVALEQIKTFCNDKLS